MCILGRDEVADIQILEKSVSRRHALVQVDNGSVKVTDLGSSQGTKINGAKLVPDLPSSLEAGDFITMGRVTLTYHETPPPVAPTAPAATPAPARRTERPARRKTSAPPRGGNPDLWKYIALGAAFVAVAGISALIAVLTTKSDPPPPVVAQPAANPDPVMETEKAPDPIPADAEPQPAGETRAAAGELPPQGYLSVREFPMLLEFSGDVFYPVKTRTWDGSIVVAQGGDGRIYEVPQNRVKSMIDRIDLARRTASARARLNPDDADAHLELAKWAARRYLKSETRTLAKRVLELRPSDQEAARLLRGTE